MATHKPQVRIINNRFNHVRKQAITETAAAVRAAVAVGEAEAKNRLQRGESQRGYSLNTLYDTIHQESDGTLRGKVVAGGGDAWYGRLFEYGTVYITAIPFMRPASRKMRKTFMLEMGGLFKGFRTSRRR